MPEATMSEAERRALYERLHEEFKPKPEVPSHRCRRCDFAGVTPSGRREHLGHHLSGETHDPAELDARLVALTDAEVDAEFHPLQA